MTFEVFWSDEAKETFDAIFWFIYDRFGETSTYYISMTTVMNH